MLQTLVALAQAKPGRAMPETYFRNLPQNRPNLLVSAESERITIWLAGEQDCSNSGELMDACAAALLYDQDLVIDVSDVEFMSAATVDVIVSISELLGVRKHSLAVRAPSKSTRRLFDLCSVSDLIGEPANTGMPSALNSWVHVPVDERAPLTSPKKTTAKDRPFGPSNAGRDGT
jgi:anti-anti-sigma factor